MSAPAQPLDMIQAGDMVIVYPHDGLSKPQPCHVATVDQVTGTKRRRIKIGGSTYDAAGRQIGNSYTPSRIEPFTSEGYAQVMDYREYGRAKKALRDVTCNLGALTTVQRMALTALLARFLPAPAEDGDA